MYYWVSIKERNIWRSIGCTRSRTIAEIWAGRARIDGLKAKIERR